MVELLILNEPPDEYGHIIQWIIDLQGDSTGLFSGKALYKYRRNLGFSLAALMAGDIAAAKDDAVPTAGLLAPCVMAHVSRNRCSIRSVLLVPVATDTSPPSGHTDM